MANFSKEEVAKLALLAHLDVSDRELDALHHDLNQIVGYVDRLEQVDVTGLEPMQHAFDAKNIWREDVVQPSLPQEVALQNAPHRIENFFAFPRIVPTKKGEASAIESEDIE
ncbi:MAG: Asp-tRNA(Asn)/Glu-tRNA(Gln) amidotransferase subunit GatC [bacterium]|nr:Asp-tRNA(Asn)/Glu-tRNA(Gln) amidotransferase subunit GatC [bacterium]